MGLRHDAHGHSLRVRFNGLENDALTCVIRAQARPCTLQSPPQKTAAAHELVDEFLRDGLIKPVVSDWAAPALLVPKPNTTPVQFRLVIDYRELNKLIAHDTFEPPSCELCINWLAGRPYRSSADLRWAFHQCAISKRMSQYFAFVLPFGTFTYTRLTMGFLNATAEFQRTVNHTCGDSLWRCCVAMVDDLIIASETEEQHMTDLNEVLAKLAARGHSLKASKLKLMLDEIEYLGRISTPWGVLISPRHKTAVLEIPYPPNNDGAVDLTRLRSGLGLFKFCRPYIPKCAWLCAPLNGLVSPNTVQWDSIHKPPHKNTCVGHTLRCDRTGIRES